MVQPTSALGVGDPRLNRRRLLVAGIGLAAALFTGCTVSDPRVGTAGESAQPTTVGRSGRTTTHKAAPLPSASPTFAGSAAAAVREQRLAQRAVAILEGPHRKQLGKRRATLTAVRDAHLAHAAALRSPTPTARPVGPPPAAPSARKHSGGSLKSALKRLAAAETKAAASYETAATGTTGFAALLWGSLGVAAASYAAAVRSETAVPIRAPRPPRPMPQVSDVRAMQALVAQLHAIIYGYQLAIGQLKVSSPTHDRAVERLREHRLLVDALIAQLLAGAAEVPAAEPAYVPSVRPRSSRTAQRLLRSMEAALAPFCGWWLSAASTGEDRKRAYAALQATVATARSWGEPLQRWPGWND